VYIPGQRKLRDKRSRVRYWMRRRSAIEPIIGHIKNDGSFRRNYLLGEDGDPMQAVLSGVGFNIRKLIKGMEPVLSFFYGFITSYKPLTFQKI